MSWNDPTYLRNDQYRDGCNLSARIELHQRFSTNRYPWHRWVFDHIDPTDRIRLLEIGCGTGDLWLANQERLPPGWQPLLSDHSIGMVRSAFERLTNATITPLCLVADAPVLPVADQALDVVVANHMLYHVPDLSRALAEIRRVLRPGGRFYAATNGQTHLQELDALVSSVAPDTVWHDDAARFGLENGAARLRPWFTGVERDDYPDRLEITEVEPAVRYLLSTPSKDMLDKRHRERLRNEIAATIARDGAFRVTKSVGIFAGVRRE